LKLASSCYSLKRGVGEEAKTDHDVSGKCGSRRQDQGKKIQGRVTRTPGENSRKKLAVELQMQRGGKNLRCLRLRKKSLHKKKRALNGKNS